VRSTRISRRVNAPRASVYRALLDARAVATWKVPSGMTSRVHAFRAARRDDDHDLARRCGRRQALAKLAALVEAG